MNQVHTPDIEPFKQAVLDNIISCAEQSEPKRFFTLFQFAGFPDSEAARAIPERILTRFLDYLESAQREDGGWDDEHGLKHWQPYFTTVILLALRNYGRL